MTVEVLATAVPEASTSTSAPERVCGVPVKSHELGNGSAQGGSSPVRATTPVVCPACQSRAITTAARNPDENTYWRCDSCGEVWNASRREAGPSRAHSWR